MFVVIWHTHQASMGPSASRRYFSTAAGVYSSLDARSPSRARDLLKRPACGRPTRCEDAAPKSPEALSQFTRTEPSPEGVWGLCDVAPVSEERTPTGALRRRADAAARETLIQFARALASQRPPSRERPPLGGGGAGRALFPSLWLSPLSLSLDRRRGAPSSSSKRSARVQLCWHRS